MDIPRQLRWPIFIFCAFIQGQCLFLAYEGPVLTDVVFTSMLFITEIISIGIMIVADPTKKRRDYDQ
jgi:hypothetical protein